ncbi:hypothetical protein [Kineococcus auxinigenes]|uniref:hypothetical protein n=1 Tax=unclassified Kineococcus TaxID=2621656 RepID=UPI003D7F131C
MAGALQDTGEQLHGQAVPAFRYAAGYRIGALDFQDAPDRYVARDGAATLDELLHLAALVQDGRAVPPSRWCGRRAGTSCSSSASTATPSAHRAGRSCTPGARWSRC